MHSNSIYLGRIEDSKHIQKGNMCQGLWYNSENPRNSKNWHQNNNSLQRLSEKQMREQTITIDCIPFSNLSYTRNNLIYSFLLTDVPMQNPKKAPYKSIKGMQKKAIEKIKRLGKLIDSYLSSIHKEATVALLFWTNPHPLRG